MSEVPLYPCKGSALEAAPRRSGLGAGGGAARALGAIRRALATTPARRLKSCLTHVFTNQSRKSTPPQHRHFYISIGSSKQ